MEIEFYDKEEHDFFLDEFKEYSREPTIEEKEFFRETLEELVGEISRITESSTDFKLYFAMTEEENLQDDLPINRFVHGYSFANWMEGFDRDVIMMRATRDRGNWKDCLTNMLAHEMAHQEYYDHCKNPPVTNLENILIEGHAMNRAEQVALEMNLEWRPHYRKEKPPEINSEAIIEILDEKRTYGPEDIFKNGQGPCENAEGYQIAYLVIKDLTENTTLTLEDVASEDAEEIRKRVEGSLRKLLA